MPSPPTSYHLVGEHVQLSCAIAPGAFLQQYYVTWSRSGQVIYQTNPNSAPERPSDDRIELSPNLSLIINDVQLSDASGNYRCVLRVVDPNSRFNQIDTYDILRDIDIPLVVLGKLLYYNIILR